MQQLSFKQEEHLTRWILQQEALNYASIHAQVLWWGEMAPPLKRSLDLGNSFPILRALMYNKS
jgi:hypothetical protein